ncbi:hypothetical protein H2200_007377 [Cladophialophora chaetospira]|uniref:DUF5648 domain-containing protein n=1 Tax=Cladophialophora chaetospira TaxID=386627 RepID=A0AA38X7W1_9EURO|nr:hypothetical protein H2200_007377 [Cladophialophora chaetospira]
MPSDHFYTLDPNGEFAPSTGYEPQGITGYVHSTQHPGTIPIYRWYNPASTDHFYTADSAGEVAPPTYTSEGVAWYMFSDQVENTVALHRWHSPTTGDHFYTTDGAGERAKEHGYVAEGITGYLHPYQVEESVPLYRWFNSRKSYNFSVESIEIKQIRSQESDTIYVSASVTIAGHPPRAVTKRIGDRGKGSFPLDVVLKDVSLADHEVAVFSYVIINDGHSKESNVTKVLEQAARKLSEAGANQVGDAVKEAVGAAVGAGVGAVIGSSVPVIGTIVGAALGSLAGSLLGGLFDMVGANCDGPLAAGTYSFTGMQLHDDIHQRDHNPGIDSPHGCGANSDYYTTWSVTRAD